QELTLIDRGIEPAGRARGLLGADVPEERGPARGACVPELSPDAPHAGVGCEGGGHEERVERGEERLEIALGEALVLGAGGMLVNGGEEAAGSARAAAP